MADSKVGLGPTGETVSDNVRRLRGRMTYKELSETLGAAGRPIPVLGLRRIEAGERRVDSDDLVALAVVLGVTPNALILPPHADQRMVTLSGAGPALPAETAWLWADGHEPLWKESNPTHQLTDNDQMRRQEFYARSIPRPDYDPEESRQMKSEYSPPWRAKVAKELADVETLVAHLSQKLKELEHLKQRLDQLDDLKGRIDAHIKTMDASESPGDGVD